MSPLYGGQNLRVLPPREVQELLKKCPLVTLLFGSLQRRTQVRRMFVAEFIDEAEVFVCFLSVEWEVSGDDIEHLSSAWSAWFSTYSRGRD